MGVARGSPLRLVDRDPAGSGGTHLGTAPIRSGFAGELASGPA